MALISGVALALLAGSAQPSDAAAGMRFYSTDGWFMGGTNVPVRKHATTVKRQKSEPKKDTGFGETPKGPLAANENRDLAGACDRLVGHEALANGNLLFRVLSR